MSAIRLPFKEEGLSAYVAKPDTPGPKPGVVVIHDALGMSTDLRRQCDWLAHEGYTAVAPDLFSGKTFFSCIFKVLREFKKKEGDLFDKIETVRQYLLAQPDSNGKVGVIGFCFGGGFAIILSVGFGFDTASINYGGDPSKDAEILMKDACPIVASYGALEKGAQKSTDRLEKILTDHGIDHDVKLYEKADHAFMNNHDPEEVPGFIKIVSVLFGGGAYHVESAEDAQRRIIAFFDKHLT